jgi:hypothetical protein
MLRFEELRLARPSRRQLSLKASQLESELTITKTNRDWETAEEIFARLEATKAKFQSEKKAEGILGARGVGDALPELVDDQNLGRQAQISGLTIFSADTGATTFGGSSGSADMKTRISQSVSSDSSTRPGAVRVGVSGPGTVQQTETLISLPENIAEETLLPPRSMYTSSYTQLLPVARRISERATKEQQKSSLRDLVQEKEKVWTMIRREVLLDEMKNLHSYFNAKGRNLHDYFKRTATPSEESTSESASQMRSSLDSENSSEPEGKSELDARKQSISSTRKSDSEAKFDITLPALWTDGDSEKWRGDVESLLDVADPNVFSDISSNLKPEFNLERTADRARDSNSGPRQGSNSSSFLQKSNNQPPLSGAPLHARRHPPTIMEGPVFQDASPSVTSASHADFETASKEDIDDDTVVERFKEEDMKYHERDDDSSALEITSIVSEGDIEVGSRARRRIDGVSTTGSTVTTRDDDSHIEQIMDQAIMDMNIPCATVVRAGAEEVFPEESAVRPNLQLLRKVARRFRRFRRKHY